MVERIFTYSLAIGVVQAFLGVRIQLYISIKDIYTNVDTISVHY